MTSADVTLYRFSVAFAVWAAVMLVVPILRRKSDVFTAWNFFLVGAFIFNGLSGINAATAPHYLPDLSRSSYTYYYIGTIVFYTTITLTYYYVKFPRRLAGNTMLSWADVKASTAPFIAGALMLLVVGIAVRLPIPVVGQLLTNFGFVSPSIALAIITVVWFRDRTNVLLIGLLFAFLFAAVGAALMAGISRRFLMSALAAIPIALYWVWLRYQPTPKILLIIGAALASTIPVVAGFTAIRHSLQDEEVTPLQRAQRMLTALPEAVKSGGSSEGFTGQDSVECALSVIQLLNDGSKTIEVTPLHSLAFIATNPIPRSVWPDKPSSIGTRLVFFFGLKGINANLGLNVVGQCYYEGGLIIHVLYGVMMGCFLRYFDELLIRQPGNPFLIGGLTAMSAQIIGWPRGGIEAMGMQILQGFILMMITNWVAKLFFGAGVHYPRTGNVAEYPVLRSQSDLQRWMSSYTALVPSFQRRPAVSDD